MLTFFSNNFVWKDLKRDFDLVILILINICCLVLHLEFED